SCVRRSAKHGGCAADTPTSPQCHAILQNLTHTTRCQSMAALSTYVGHAKISDTYWYLTGVPELMAVAGKRFELFASTVGGGHHD
ncbi:hypothetical protein NKH81_34520, partial [Mesorhizobium sp. M0959]